jgi:hypothetical protein
MTRNVGGEAWRKNWYSLARPDAAAGVHVPKLAAADVHIS